MTEMQKPINSGYGPRTTTAEILEGRDLHGKLAIVTGGYSGLGLETVRALSDSGVRIVVPALRPDAARAALAGIDNVEIGAMNLADLQSVEAFARDFAASGRHADIVICSAGIMACPETRIGPGWEAQFATNHLGHFALIGHLWPAIRNGSRIVAVSSGAHRISGIRWDDVQFKTGYDRWQAYGQSKTANALFAVHLDALGRDHGVRAFSLHPGAILTPLQRHLSKEEMIASGWIDEDGEAAPSFKTPQQGAATQAWAATSPQLDGIGGLYCEDCDVAPIAQNGGPGVAKHAADPVQAARLWQLSVELTGINPFKNA